MTDFDVIIYHGGCWDGFASAMIAKEHNEDAVLVPGWYGMDIPENITGKKVLIVDYSFDPETMIEIANLSKSTLWLDHHKTAVEAMAPVLDFFIECGGTAITDMDRSGATITWDYFNSAEDRPWLVDYIEDRDLWRKALDCNNEVMMWVRSHEMTEESWDEMRHTALSEAVTEGRAMYVYHSRLVSNAAHSGFVAKLGDIELPMTTTSYDIGSETCDYLINNTDYDLAGYCLLNGHGDYQYGLRSAKGYDCSVIAKEYGGGGHAQACGFKSDKPLHEWVSKLELN